MSNKSWPMTASSAVIGNVNKTLNDQVHRQLRSLDHEIQVKLTFTFGSSVGLMVIQTCDLKV